MKTKIGVLLLGILSVQTAVLAQAPKTGGAAPASAGPPASVPNSTAIDPGRAANRDWTKMIHDGKSGDFLYGSVKVSNGALPWDSIPVAVTCNGKTSFTTSTDPKGDFVIAMAEPKGSTPLDVNRKHVGSMFVGCKVDASLAGFNSRGVMVAEHNVLDNPNIGTITLSQEEGAKGTSSSSTSAAAAKDAVKSFDKARVFWMDNKPDRAEKELQKAVQIYPQYAEAWYQLGKVQEAAKSADARNSFLKAVAADALFVPPHEHLMTLAAQAGNWQEVVGETNREIELNPRGTLQVWYYHALGNMQLNKMDVAEVSAKKSLSMDPLHEQPNTEQLLAVILAGRQDYSGALEHLRNCLTYFPPGPSFDLVKQQIAQLELAVQPSK